MACFACSSFVLLLMFCYGVTGRNMSAAYSISVAKAQLSLAQQAGANYSC
jgi:hypothetical protein